LCPPSPPFSFIFNLKSLGLGQQDVHPFDLPPSEQHVEFTALHGDIEPVSQHVDDHEAGIVAGLAIRIARVAQSGD
jgi:hypothetical protein